MDHTSLPRNSNVVLYVHGHRTRYYKVIAALSHLFHICQNTVAADSCYVIGFLWPCHSKKVSSAKAKDKASTQAALRLTNSIAALQHHGNQVHVIGHSMGCRVALVALRDTSILLPVSSFLLLAAAVSEKEFLSEFPRSALKANKIVNVYSLEDDVLQKGFVLGERLSTIYNWFGSTLAHKDKPVALDIDGARDEAIGLCGVAQPSDQFVDIDASSQVHTHSIHAYLAAPIVHAYIIKYIEAFDSVLQTNPEKVPEA